MAIQLGALALPDGLRWSDEFSWSPTVRSTSYGLTGALLVQSATRQDGRPLTLSGGRQWAWCSRAELTAIAAALDAATPETALILTLHDGRAIPVIARPGEDGPITAAPVPIVRDSGPADPGPMTRYYIDEIRLTIVGEIQEP
ncbi:hypothetical protein MARPU_05795 [Marichromatium purpuratum 984]|uniref:Uncharacterized protein n=1 Tax=Marichromatium purpuratum 984 TaxID=765910 RepID=W0DXU7_MARPU|nr:hypothetical protein [Marichromatium purpuratum]AHF03440.1 hypothetical protein MARPU_05795 [Marichromatium purpuratum 984]